MKKVFLAFAALLLCSTIYAQGVSFGLKAGLNFANQKFSASGFSISPDSRTGFHAGAYLNAAFSDMLSLQPELLYNSVGSKVGDFENEANYLSIPIVLKVNPVPIFNIHAGPQFGFLMSAKGDGDDVKDQYKSLDIGAAIGAGLDLPMGLNLTVRYVFGLGNIAEDIDNEDITVKNNVFQASLGYKLFGTK